MTWQQQFQAWIEETQAEINFLTSHDPVALEAKQIMGEAIFYHLVNHKRKQIAAWKEDLCLLK